MAIFKNKFLILFFKMLSLLLISITVFLIIGYSVVDGESKFSDTYQSVIRRKYDTLVETKSPKIIIVGGSNNSFGIDSALLSEKTGCHVVNMGLHAGFGPLFNSEIIKSNINKGDIVLLSYEYDTLKSEKFEKLGDINLIMSAIENKLEIYREIPVKNLPEIFGNIFKFANEKAKKNYIASGAYSSSAFDASGNMIFEREEYILPDYENNTGYYGQVNGSALIDTNDKYEYLTDFKEYIQKQGASVYFVSSVLLEDAYVGTEQQLEDFATYLEETTGISFISNPNAYLFSKDYMYDTIYHCNSQGQIKRTEQLIDDLKTNRIIM